MSNTDPETPVGQIPVTGGRERRYANDAERARAWRERQKERRGSSYDDGATEAVSPVLAEASLSVLLERLTEVGRAHEATVGELMGRIEEAISALADPEAVAEALAGGRAEAARQVAEAEERAIRSSQAKTAAEATAREAVQDRTEAEEAANAAWERAESLESELTAIRQELTLSRENAAQEARRHSDEIEALRTAHVEQLNEERHQHELAISEVREAARGAVEEASASRDRAEGTVAELRAELVAARRTADETAAAIRSEAAAARAELADQLAGRYTAEGEAARAKAEAEIARAQAHADSAREIAENRASEIERLVAQVEDLRTDLRRSRRDP
jgi:DNA repair exonuclease SbcCD ATPase subunit